MYRIYGHLQNYAWGVPGGLVAWQAGGDQVASADAGAPQAELWYGAHQNGPSVLVDDPGTLRDQVDAEQAPLLVKMLAAARPLSIQIHPPAEVAARDFAAQQADPTLPQLLTDSLAKTEMLVAVRPFSVLQGLRDPAVAAAVLRGLGGLLEPIAEKVTEGDVKTAIRWLLAMDPTELATLTPRVPVAAASAGLLAPAVEALALVAANYPGDPGVLVAVLLDHRSLGEGEAVYVPAGVVHAYVHGTGVEVMTSSDNVLRLGLTPKTIAVDESLAALDVSASPQPMSGDPVELPGGGTHRHYAPAGAPFIVDWVSGGSFTAVAGAYRLVLALGGNVAVSVNDERINLVQGQALAVLADDPDATVRTSGAVVIARAATS